MAEEMKVTCRPGNAGTFMGSLWFMGWLFTIGFLRLAFWKGVLALLVWPYYLGVFFHPK
ncbi:MAG TPA: hypothetical protein VID50_10760 [Candidatus Eisenbacteria bacterium]|jgi:hypothetical protein